MSKPSVFQPDHSGKMQTVPVKPGMHISHASHGAGEHITGHSVPGNIARDGAAKKLQPVAVNGAMFKQSKSGAMAVGGDHSSAIDSLNGAEVVPGRVTAQPGWGNSGAQSGHPLAKAPAGKNLSPVPPSFGMRTRGATPDDAMHVIGEAIMQEAFAASACDDCVAHGRQRNGSK